MFRVSRSTPQTFTSVGEKLVWHKSSHSGAGNCVEVAVGPGGVFVRDTKNRSGGTLQFSQGEWAAFIVGVRGGEFDLPESPG